MKRPWCRGWVSPFHLGKFNLGIIQAFWGFYYGFNYRSILWDWDNLPLIPICPNLRNAKITSPFHPPKKHIRPQSDFFDKPNCNNETLVWFPATPKIPKRFLLFTWCGWRSRQWSLRKYTQLMTSSIGDVSSLLIHKGSSSTLKHYGRLKLRKRILMYIYIRIYI